MTTNQQDQGVTGRCPADPRASGLFATTQVLRIVPAFTATEARVFPRPFANAYLSNAMSLTNRAELSRFPAVQSPMERCVNPLNVLWTAARRVVAGVVNMLPRRPVERFVHEAMNALQFPFNPHKTIAVGVFGCGPNPAFPFDAKAVVQSFERFMCEHERSIQSAGFKCKPSGFNQLTQG